MIHRAQLEAAIEDALTRVHWPTAEAAARACTEAVMARLAEEPGLDTIEDGTACTVGVIVTGWQADLQADPPDCVRRNEAVASDAGPVPADPCDGLPLAEFSEAPPGKVYRLTPEERPPEVAPPPDYLDLFDNPLPDPASPEFKPGEVISRFRPLPDAEPELPDGLGRD